MSTESAHKTPVNILTGFLGVGKTTTIRHLLETKPKSETWAVLVNEFGDVGIDGALLQLDEIRVKEVTGGCICCSVSLPSSQAIIQLIETVAPDRIIIEPTGLALPNQILNMLEKLNHQITLQAMICLVDPWCFHDKKLLSTPVFTDQINTADLVVATKSDIAEPRHLKAFSDYMATNNYDEKHIQSISHGQLDWTLLKLPHQKDVPQEQFPDSNDQSHNTYSHTHHNNDESLISGTIAPDAEGVTRIENSADFGFSCGWLFPKHWQFDIAKLESLFNEFTVPRIKGIFATEYGWTVINKMRKVVSIEDVNIANDSRLEMISMEQMDWQEIDLEIRKCRLVS